MEERQCEIHTYIIELQTRSAAQRELDAALGVVGAIAIIAIIAFRNLTHFLTRGIL